MGSAQQAIDLKEAPTLTAYGKLQIDSAFAHTHFNIQIRKIWMKREKQSGSSRDHGRGHGGAAFGCVATAGGRIAGAAGDDFSARGKKLRLHDTGAGRPPAGITWQDPVPSEKIFLPFVIESTDGDDLPAASGTCDAFFPGT